MAELILQIIFNLQILQDPKTSVYQVWIGFCTWKQDNSPVMLDFDRQQSLRANICIIWFLLPVDTWFLYYLLLLMPRDYLLSLNVLQ